MKFLKDLVIRQVYLRNVITFLKRKRKIQAVWKTPKEQKEGFDLGTFDLKIMCIFKSFHNNDLAGVLNVIK